MEYKVTTKVVKISKVLDAMEKNGYPQITGFMVETKERKFGPFKLKPKIAGACAMGQAALNLDIEPHSLHKALAGVLVWGDDGFGSLSSHIILKNDGKHIPVREIARQIRRDLNPSELDQSITVSAKGRK